MRVLLRLAPLVTARALRDPEHARPLMYDAGSLKPLTREAVPVVVDHDEDRVIGTVVEFYPAEDAAGGRWLWARCDVTAPPAWLKRDGGCSLSYITFREQAMDGWSRILDARVKEVSLLSPSVRPAEARARVAWIGEEGSASTSGAKRTGSSVADLAPATGETLPSETDLEREVIEARIARRERDGILVRRGVGTILQVR